MNCRGQSGNIAVYALNFNDFTSAARITAEVSRGRTFFDIDITTADDSDGWLAQLGAVFFGASWIWSLVTSLSLLREAREKETQAQGTKR